MTAQAPHRHAGEVGDGGDRGAVAKKTEQHAEVERKYDVEVACPIPSATAIPGTTRTSTPIELHQVATYYDTEDLRLLSAGVTLRRRSGGVDDGWHLKLPAGGDRRDEVRLPDDASDPTTTVPDALVDRVRGIVRDRPVAPVAVLETHRRVHRLLDEQELVLAELCDDHVTARTATDAPAVQEWREWELELVDGPVDLLDAAEPILVESGARPATASSKLARALADSLPARPIWRSREAPGKDATTAELVSAYLGAQLLALEKQDLSLRGGGEEGVHQLRVAARRLRSALATYASLFDPGAATELRSELRWLGREMAGARDAQVLRQRLMALVDGQPAELVLGPVRSRLDDSLRGRYDTGRAVANEALDSERYLRLLDRLEKFLDAPPFTGDAGRPARKITPGLLTKDLERVRRRHQRYRRARTLQERDLALHEVRKASKRLRYAAETTRPVFGGRATRLASRAEAVQEVLGDHQDTVVSRTVLREIGVQAFLAGENAFTFGRLHGLEEARAGQLERDFPDALAKLPRSDLRSWLRR